MESLLNFYQHLPEHIDPVALSLGFLSVKWYSIMYWVAFIVAYLLLNWRIKNDISDISNPKSKINNYISDFIIFAIIGLLIGARLGYVLFYNLPYYLHNPLMIISPYDFSAHQFVGISGMSYFGGLAGTAVATFIFTRRNKIGFLGWADFVVPAVPAGYFFGRIGNFLNGELYGRATEKFWGMYFSGGGLILRHPSQFYEAILEGLVLFIILWVVRRQSRFPGFLFSLYLLGYGIFRFLIEYWREPDSQIGLFFGSLTLGQIFSLLLVSASGALYFWQGRKKMVE